jgi:methyl-accepting chemotaxis protein
MKKTIVITESQLKRIQEQEWSKPDDNNDLVDKAQKDLSNFQKAFDSYYNMIMMVSISEIINDTEYYTSLLSKLETLIELVQGKFDYYFDIVESHDFFERPDEISTLGDLTNDMQDTLYELKDIKYVLDDMLDLTKKISGMQPRNVIKLNENKR